MLHPICRAQKSLSRRMGSCLPRILADTPTGKSGVLKNWGAGMTTRAMAFATMIFVLLSLDSRIGPTAFGRQENRRQPDGLFDLSLEELMEVDVDTVYSASKYEQKVSEAPSSITIITADEIRRYGYRTLGEALRSVPGFYINHDRNYTYLGVRGFRRPGDYDTRVLLLVDGHRANENVGDSPFFGTQFVVDIDLVERIEIIRGPGSSLYGSNALLGVINVITKRGKALNGVELSGELASADTHKGRISYGTTWGDASDLLVSGTLYDSGGQRLYYAEFDDPATANGLVTNDDDRFENLFVKATVGDLSLIAAYNDSEKGVPTAPWDVVFGDRRTRTYDETALVGLAYSHELSEKASIIARTAYHHYNYDGRWVYDYSEDDTPYLVVNKDYWRGRFWESELQVVVEPIEKHKVTVGGEFHYNARQDQRVWDEEIYLDDSRDGSAWGLYVQDEFQVLGDTTLVAGVRYDRYDTFGGTINPRLALIRNFDSDTTLKLLYGRAFRAPNAYELYYHDGGYTQKAAQDLEPETIETYEAVLERHLTEHLRTSLSGFYYKMQDLIDQYVDPDDGLIVFKNLDAVKAGGVELALNGHWDRGIRTRASYSYVVAEDEATGETLVNSPKHLAKLNLMAPILDETLFAGLEVQYNGTSETLAGNDADDFVLTNLTLTYVSPSKQMEVSAGLYNLFDVEYAYPGFAEHTQDVIEQDGLMFRMKLTYRF